MKKTWASGAIELLRHANAHIGLHTAFDKRIAFISIDNAVEITVKTYLSLPKQFFGADRPSKKELDECNNSFTSYLNLLFKNAEKKLTGIEVGDIEHYHRIRNTLYHDGTGLAVDQEYINAYFIISKLLLKRLFNIDFIDQPKETSLEQLILNWNHIEEYLAQIFEFDFVDIESYEWKGDIPNGLLTVDLVKKIKELHQLRNKIVHSKSIDKIELLSSIEKSKTVMEELKQEIAANKGIVKNKNFYYEPATSEIKGKLTLNKFYGPPGYGDTPDIDRIERAWILNLEHPINVYQKDQNPKDNMFNFTEFNIDKVHLVFLHKIGDLDKYENKIITAKGSFFGAHTGHHRTSVLMTVDSIDAGED